MTTQNDVTSATEAFDTLESMSDAVAALHYLATLLDVATTTDAGALADHGSGLHYLMQAQLELLGGDIAMLRGFARSQPNLNEARMAEAIRRALFAEASRPAWHDLDTIAARSRVHRSDVARVMFVLTGEDHEGDAYHAWDGNPAAGVPAHLLTGLCWDTLGNGELWGRVSDASGLGLHRVKQVLELMIEFSPKRQELAVPDAFKDQPFGALRARQAEERATRERVETQDAEGPSADALEHVGARLQRADLAQLARDLEVGETDLRAAIEGLIGAQE